MDDRSAPSSPSPSPSRSPEWDCPICQARNDASAGVCWLCQSSRSGKPPTLIDAEVDRVVPAAGKGARAWPRVPVTLVLLAIAAAVVAVGLASESPGLAIVVVLLLLPALVHTGFRGDAARARGEEVRPESLAAAFLKSVIVTGVILGGLAMTAFVALVIGLFVVCSGMLGR